jgi:hypothetical protein
LSLLLSPLVWQHLAPLDPAPVQQAVLLLAQELV